MWIKFESGSLSGLLMPNEYLMLKVFKCQPAQSWSISSSTSKYPPKNNLNPASFCPTVIMTSWAYGNSLNSPIIPIVIFPGIAGRPLSRLSSFFNFPEGRFCSGSFTPISPGCSSATTGRGSGTFLFCSYVMTLFRFFPLIRSSSDNWTS